MLDWAKNWLINHREPKERPLRIHVIYNPAAGQHKPVLNVLSSVFETAGVEWDVFVTKEAGDGSRLARKAVKARVDRVAVIGGDGTVSEVVSGLLGSLVPFAVIPAGTANVLSLELGIPFDLPEACALAVNPNAAVRVLDVGQIGKFCFLLKAGTGFNAAMVEGADRDMKERLGVYAYGLGALQALADPPLARYRLVLDGQEIDSEGLASVIANCGTMGIPGMPAVSLAPGIDMSDGLLDVIVFTRSDLPAFVSLIANFMTGNESPQVIQHWKAREVTIIADPPQTVQADGEILGPTPVTARVIPLAVRVIVPTVADRLA